MTLDETLTNDLAVVARTSRARPIALEATLAGIDRDATLARVRDRPALRWQDAVHVARASAGFATVLSIGALLAWLALGHPGGTSAFDALVYMPKLWVAVIVVGVAATAFVVAQRLALGRARAARAWSIAGSIVGAMAFCVFFGMMQVVLGGFELFTLIDAPGEWPLVDLAGIQRFAYLAVAGAIAASAVGAVVVARCGGRPWFLGVGAVLLGATIAAGLALDVGPLVEQAHPQAAPSLVLRALLTATGTAGLFLVVASLVLRVHARDDQYAS